jgi:hypothetical protein
MTAAAASASPLTSVFAGRRCVGFLFRRGAAVIEAFDERQSLGLFENQDAAIAAIAGAAINDSQANK